MAGGRPTKYKKEYCEKIIEYFSKRPDSDQEEVTYYQNGSVKSRKPGPWEFPTFQGFAFEIGVTVPTLLKWTTEHKEFFNAYARAKEIQEAIWLQESMAGRYNAQFAKFFGVNCLGYKDKVEQETTITDYHMTFQEMTRQEADDISG